MRIAVTYDNGMIYTHYSRTPALKISHVTGGRIIDTEFVQVHGFVRNNQVDNMLRMYNVDVLICDRIGVGARLVIAASGIKIVDRQRGSADHAVARYLGMPFTPPAPKRPPRPVAPVRQFTQPRAPKPVAPPKPAPAPKPPKANPPKPAAPKPAPKHDRPAPPKPSVPGRSTPPQPKKTAGAPSGRPQGMGGRPAPGGNSRGGGFRK